MITELYDRIKEQDRFSDVFKPISKEEKEKRQKERLEDSDYEYLYTGDIRGEFGLSTEEEVSNGKIAGILMQIVGSAYKSDVHIELDVEVFNTSLIKGLGGIVGSFSGNFVVLSYWDLDEVVIAEIVSDYAQREEGSVLELENIEVTNLKEIRKNDQP